MLSPAKSDNLKINAPPQAGRLKPSEIKPFRLFSIVVFQRLKNGNIDLRHVEQFAHYTGVDNAPT